MKTIDEMIEVMKAYKEGKTIEFRINNVIDGITDWMDCFEPIWNWDDLDYRVKSEPKYVPYTSVLEVNKDKWVKCNDRNILFRIDGIDLDDDNLCVSVSGDWIRLTDLFDNYTYEDGTPCGKLVEE